MNRTKSVSIWFIVVLTLLIAGSAGADTTGVWAKNVPATNIALIEAAEAGDTVIIFPGTYEFCVKLTNSGTGEDAWITIMGSDTNDKPVIDFAAYENYTSNTDTEYDATNFGLGSYAGGTWGQGTGTAPHSIGNNRWTRAAFHTDGAGYIRIEDIEFRNIYGAGGVNAIRVLNPDGNGPIRITRCRITGCESGIDYAVEPDPHTALDTLYVSYCQVDSCGIYPPDIDSYAGHPIYVHAGVLVLENSYIHDPTGGQVLHLGCKKALIRYNVLARPYSYMSDISSYNYGDLEEPQEHTYIGNIFIHSQGEPADLLEFSGWFSGGVFTMMQNNQGSTPSQTLNFYYNTFIGDEYVTGKYFINPSNSASLHTILPSIVMYNNIFYGNTRPWRLGYPYGGYDGAYGEVDIQYNWWPAADYSAESDAGVAWADSMSNNLFGSDPGFVYRGGGYYSLTDSAEVIGEADSTLGDLPDYEYVYGISRKARTDRANLGAYEEVLDTLHLLAGTYTDQLVIAHSGTDTAPFVVKLYATGTAYLTGGIAITGDYVTIDGYYSATDSFNIVTPSITVTGAADDYCEGIIVKGVEINDSTSTMTTAGIDCDYTRYSTFKNNYIRDAVSGGIHLDSSSQWNLVEGNIIGRCGGAAYESSGILIAGSHNSIRKNVVYCPADIGIFVKSYASNACDSNLVYNNTVFGSGFALKIEIDNSTSESCLAEHSLFQNNIFMKSTGTYNTYEPQILIDLSDADSVNAWVDTCRVTTIIADLNWGSNTFVNNSIRRTSYYDYDGIVTLARYDGCGAAVYPWGLYSDVQHATEWRGNFLRDPMLVSEDPDTDGLTSDWFHTCTCSWVIDRGAVVVDTIGTHVEALHTGYGWSILVSNGRPDIGAYEIPGGVSPDPVPPRYSKDPIKPKID